MSSVPEHPINSCYIMYLFAFMEIVLDAVCTALADPVRRRVVELLSEGPRRAGELAEAIGVAPPVMSRHLRLLLESDVVDDERSPADARVRLFYLKRESLAALRGWLDRVDAGPGSV